MAATQELTPEQKAKRDALKGTIGPLVSEIVEEQFKRLREELRGGAGGTNRIDRLLEDEAPPEPGTPARGVWGADGRFHISASEKRGIAAAQVIRCLAAAKMLGCSALEFAKEAHGHSSRVLNTL